MKLALVEGLIGGKVAKNIIGGRTLARRKGPIRTSLGYQASKQ
jgi:hypothetical protein